jgi:pSer/pThr/pTyr-binding forkhead associated (FHA) protein
VRVLPPPLRAVSPSELAARLEVERTGEAFLLYLDGAGRQQIVRLAARTQPLSVGRSASNDVALEGDDEVSRVHAMLEPVGNEWTVVDDGLSRNGTYVNGTRVHGRRRLATAMRSASAPP